ncbi:MAG: AAA family ATPase, partial [Nitrospira sp.]|nr:AAA family ATPase [Nitrospira sp.]
MSMNPEEIWHKSVSMIEGKVGNSIAELWFRPIKLFQIKEDQATLDIPNRFFREWIEDNYPGLISEALSGVVGYPVRLHYRIAEKIDPAVKMMKMSMEGRRERLANRGIYLNPKHTFENFVVGPSNTFARAAAKSVSEQPGKTYNPLFIYGGVGLGKTHLINAIGNASIDRNPSLSVIYVSSEQFTNEVVSALRHDKMGELKEKYRNVDVLLLDDIQFIANKTATQEEFFHTFMPF